MTGEDGDFLHLWVDSVAQPDPEPVCTAGGLRAHWPGTIPACPACFVPANQVVQRPTCTTCSVGFSPGEVMVPSELGWRHDWDCAPTPVDRSGWAQRSLDATRDGLGWS